MQHQHARELINAGKTSHKHKNKDLNRSKVTLYPEDASVVKLMYLVFTCIPGESYRRRLRSLLYLCYVFRALISSLVC